MVCPTEADIFALEDNPTDLMIGHHRAISRIHSTEISTVYLAFDETNSEEKILKLVPLNSNIIKIEDEIAIMRCLHNCRYALHLEDTFIHDQYQCLVTPHAKFGSLTNILNETRFRNGIGQNATKSIIRQILLAIQYMNDQGICHRDIKPDNILVFSWDDLHPVVVISDFGLSIFLDQDETCSVRAGTPNYIAPEIYYGKDYKRNVDIWSLGITMHFLLFNQLPFPDENTAPDLYRKAMNRKALPSYHFQKNKYLQAQDLYKRMCNYDPDQRITVEDALQHPWLKDSEVETPSHAKSQ